MRVTNKMLSDNFLVNMRNNMNNLQTIQKQMATQKEINKASDDPVKAARIMQLNTDISSNIQYNSNITDVTSFLDTTDSALGQAGDVLGRVRDLLVASGNGTYSQQEKDALKDEINTKIGELSQVMNTNYDGKFIFAGTRSDVKPVGTSIDLTNTKGNTKLIYNSNDAVNPELDIISTTGKIQLSQISGKLTTEISEGVKVDYNVSASDVLQFKNSSGTSIDLRDVLKKIVNHLDGNNDAGTAVDANATTILNTTDLQNVTDVINNLLSIRSKVGATENRMDSAKERNLTENTNMTDMLSKTEDIDIAQKTIDYATSQTVYTAALQTSAKIIQPSLLDYLR